MTTYKISYIRALILKASGSDSLLQAFFHPNRLVKELRLRGLRRSLRIAFQVIHPQKQVNELSTPSIHPSLSLDPFTNSRILARTSLSARARVNVITDSLESDSLFGGVLTSVIIGCLIANRLGRDLRVISTQRASSQLDVNEIAAHLPNLEIPKIEYAYVPNESLDSLEVTSEDIYLPTSSWTCQRAIRSFPFNRIFYILQEDERIFFTSGDISNEVQNVLLHPQISYLINTSNLRNYLIQSGCGNLIAASVSFEPSFDLLLRRAIPQKSMKDRYRIAFYARPNHHRNMFKTGVLAINAAFRTGVLDEQEWEVDFIGSSLPFTLENIGFSPNFVPKMKYLDYAEYLTTINIGLALMASPHPGYPVFDFAATGAIGITNEWPGKIDLSSISSNIVTGQSSVSGLVTAIRDAKDRLSQGPVTKSNLLLSPYSNTWENNLTEAVNFVMKRLENV